MHISKSMARPIAGKTYGTVSVERQKAMTGLEFVQGLADGTLPLNTIAETLGYDIIEAANGRVVITCEPNDTHLNPAGTVHGGLSATLLDSAMGLAIHRLACPDGAATARSECLVRFTSQQVLTEASGYGSAGGT